MDAERPWLHQIEGLVREVLLRAESDGMNREEVIVRLKRGETLDRLFPGLGDPFPGRTTAYLVWELQAWERPSGVKHG